MTNQGPVSGARSSIFVEPSHRNVCESDEHQTAPGHPAADRTAASRQHPTTMKDHHTSSSSSSSSSMTSTNSTKVCLKQQQLNNYSPTMNHSGDSTRLQSILLISTLLIATSTTLSSSSSIYNRGSYLQVAAAEPLEDPVPLSDRHHQQSHHHHHHHNQQQQRQQQQQQQRQLGSGGMKSSSSSSSMEQGKEKLSDSNSEQQWTNIRQSERAVPASSNGDKVNGISITSSFILDEDDTSVNNHDNNNNDSSDHDDDDGLGVDLSTPRTKRSPLRAAAGERRPFVDCKRLANFWEYLVNSYPALSDYLLSLALGQLDALAASAGGNSMSQELSQTVKLIGRLLSEADQLAREKQIVQIKTTLLDQPPTNPATAAAAAGGNSQQHPALAAGNSGRAWLTRVAANPAYARIVKQYLLQQLHHQSRPSPLLAAQHRLATTTTTTESSGAADISYGRVANYPHELDQSSSVSRTIDKLHLLNNHRHSNQQQQYHNKQDSQLINDIRPDSPQSVVAATASVPTEVESNQIPLIESEPDSKSSSSTNKQQQPKYVYGNVLLRPSQARAAGGLGSVDNGAQPIDKLRKYNRLHNNANSNHQEQFSQSSSSLDKSIEQSNAGAAATATATAYGRVVISPGAARHNQREEQQLSVSTLEQQQQQQSQGLGGASSLNKLRDQLEPSQLGFGVGLGGTGSEQQQQQQASLRGADDDEMATQQHASSMAAIGSDSGNNPQSADGFEGIFHSGPIEHVEATRQVRRHSSPPMAYGSAIEEANSGSDQVRITTSSPGEVLVID